MANTAATGGALPGVMDLVGASDGALAQALQLGSATNVAATSGNKALQTTGPGSWSVQSTPAVTTAPSATKAAGAAGVRHVATGALISLSAVAAQTIIYFTLRDGATGAGTILWQVGVIAPAGSNIGPVAIPLPNLPGSAATAMTLELTNASGAVTNPVATNFATATLFGMDAS
jgi:hypothetical protein